MKKISFILILLVSLYTANEAKDSKKDDKEDKKKKIQTHSNVLLLNSDNFEQALATYDDLLVDFYLPYCKNCNTVLRSEWGAAAMDLNESWGKGKNIALGKIDMSKGDNYKLAIKYKLCDYPSIKLFRDGGKTGKMIDYNGKHSKNRILKWLKKKTRKSQTTTLKTSKSYKKFLDDVKTDADQYAAIGYFTDLETNNATEFLETAEDGVIGLQFGITSDNSIFSDLEVSDGEIVLYHPELDNPIILKSRKKKIETKALLEAYMLPLLRDFVDYSTDMKKHKDSVEDHLFIATSFSSKTIHQEKYVLRKIASDYVGKALFTLVDMDEPLQLYDNILRFLDIQKAPAIGLASIRKMGVKKFKPDSNEISEKNIRNFLENYFKDKLKEKLGLREGGEKKKDKEEL